MPQKLTVQKLTARERIRRIAEVWFLREPLLFGVWMTHQLLASPHLQSIRVNHGQIEYNPRFIDSLNPRELEQAMQFEATRILLRHPYSRRKENSERSYLASNITLQEYLHSSLPFPNAKDVFGDSAFNQQYFEFYYNKLEEISDAARAAVKPETPAPLSNIQSSAGGRQSAAETQGAGESANAAAADETLEEPSAEQPDEKTGEASDQNADSENAAGSPLEHYTQAGVENAECWDEDDWLNERLNQAIEAVRESQSWGSIAGKLREQILATLKPKLDYRTVLRQFRANIIALNRELTRMKPSRRYEFLYMGSRRHFTTKLLIAVDVSGSMSSDELQRGFSTINRFFNYGIEQIDVIQFDTEIKGPPLILKKARRQVQITGRGGTDFTPVIDYIDQHRDYDGLIIFTDGYAPIPLRPKNRQTRVLWLFNHESNYQRAAALLRPIGRSIFLKADAKSNPTAVKPRKSRALMTPDLDYPEPGSYGT
ncbi:MAG: hypothetical protein IPL99_10035 [Candidatus Competibacteraceae bacterium]|nr:hypothetical protein [Candidatus Competibacteraceae bacterium]